ncbi:unnamed protein product [Leptidea sinapis]|uniref:RRM domain-containing protein n=1 Tax=Leptidea sinapis TaxID=189913 RepID=A0A5E4QBQ3_9NEOP|nr:unnamed protein product [Leptidea sinapis]
MRRFERLYASSRVVEFATHSDMRGAIEKLDGTELNGRRIKLVEDRRSSRKRSRSSSSRSRSRALLVAAPDPSLVRRARALFPSLVPGRDPSPDRLLLASQWSVGLAPGRDATESLRAPSPAPKRHQNERGLAPAARRAPSLPSEKRRER